jgi:curved DNA-binding protein CbpA
MTTLYDTLNVPENASGDEIKRAYRKAAMRWHPDRNAGEEITARAAFLDVQHAYAILSNPEQRRVYDEVYADEMKRQQALREEAERLQAEREAAARAAEEALYARMVALAMRFADQGYNRDVVFGVLLGHDCCAELAHRIADSVLALHASRTADPAAQAPEDAAAQTEDAPPDPSQSEEEAQSGSQPGSHPGAHSLSHLWFPFWNALRS